MKRLASLLLLAAACTDPEAPTGDDVTSFVERREIPLGMNAMIDVLFVIDSSPSMAAAQTKLVGDYRAMIGALATTPGGGTPDLHVGVITTDPGAGVVRGGHLADITRFNWRIESNHTEPLADAFLARATVGASGSSETRPLEAMQRALSVDVNPTMWREDAYLAVVFLTAGDDRGTSEIAPVATWLKSLKSDPGKILVTGAFGACAENGVTATAAPRLAAFLDQFPNRSLSTTLCASDLSPLTALTQQLYKTSLGLACIEHVADPARIDARLVDPETDETLVYPVCASPTDTRCYSLDANFGCVDGALAVHPHPWSTPFPAMATFEYETR